MKIECTKSLSALLEVSKRQIGNKNDINNKRFQNCCSLSVGQNLCCANFVKEYIFIVLCPKSLGTNLIFNKFIELISLLEFFFGDSEKWNASNLSFKPFKNLIQKFWENNLLTFLNGIPRFLLPNSIVDLLDRSLSSIEDIESELGSSGSVIGSMVMMNYQLLHSRLPIQISIILYYSLLLHKSSSSTTSPTSPTSPTYQFIPVYMNKKWYQCIYYYFKQFTLIFITSMSIEYDSIMNIIINKFHQTFEPILSTLPTDKPELSLRQFTSENILCFVYISTSNSYIISPQLLPSTINEQQNIKSSFNKFLLQFSDLANTSNGDYILSNNNLLFYAKKSNEFQLYILTTIETEFHYIPIIANEIIKNIKNI